MVVVGHERRGERAWVAEVRDHSAAGHRGLSSAAASPERGRVPSPATHDPAPERPDVTRRSDDRREGHAEAQAGDEPPSPAARPSRNHAGPPVGGPKPAWEARPARRKERRSPDDRAGDTHGQSVAATVKRLSQMPSSSRTAMTSRSSSVTTTAHSCRSVSTPCSGTQVEIGAMLPSEYRSAQ